MFKLTAPGGKHAVQRQAAGHIAMSTPLMLIGVHGEAELQERLRVRLGGTMNLQYQIRVYTAAAAIGHSTHLSLVSLIFSSYLACLPALSPAKVEFGDRLALAGTAADPLALSANLLATCGLAPGAPGGPSPPSNAHKKAYLLALATCEFARAYLAPLPGRGRSYWRICEVSGTAETSSSRAPV
jgi:hypothetical protein